MAKPHDWMDYASLGSNIYQNVQLSGVNDKLNAMASVAASEQAKTQREDMLREEVFQAQTLVNKLQIRQSENPAGVVAIARLNQKYLAQYDVTTASFSKFDDKERVQKVIAGFESLAQECSASLSPDQRLEAEACANYLSEREELRQFCLLQPVQEQLEKMEAELELAKCNSEPWKCIAAVGLLCVFIAILIGVVNMSDLQTTNNQPLVAAGYIAFIGLLIFGVAGSRKPMQRIPELQKERTALLEKWPALKPENSIIQSLQQQFNAKTASEVLKVQAEREAVFAKVLKTQEEHDTTG